MALTHNSRIRYTPNEKQAVMSNGVRLLVSVGQTPYPQLAKSFVATRSRIDAFLEKHEAPFIAKVYRASPRSWRRVPRRQAASCSVSTRDVTGRQRPQYSGVVE